jgi:RNA polymerase sigma-70 factor (ECF subfamily)
MIARNPFVSSELPGEVQSSDSGLPFHCPRHRPRAHSRLEKEVSNMSQAFLKENVPMNERIPMGAEVGGAVGGLAEGAVGGLAELVLPHLDSAYNLARWLVGSGEDAEDVVQEAYLRAFRYSSGFRGGDARAWLLTIVRNTSYRWLRKTRADKALAQFDEDIHTSAIEPSNPEQLLLQNADRCLVEKALSELPVRFRGILVLRELEGLSYKEIADVIGVPIGTVMSTLSRARHRFRHAVGDLQETHVASESDSSTVEGRECVGAASRRCDPKHTPGIF